MVAVGWHRTLSTLKRGDLIGHEGFLLEGLAEQAHRRIDTYAKTDVLVALFTHDNLRNLNLKHPKFAQNFFKGIIRTYILRVRMRQSHT